MVEKLIKKIIQDAEKKKEQIIKEAEERAEKLWEEKKKKIEEDFEKRLMEEKDRIKREILSEIINFRLEKRKEFLSVKNEIIKKVMEKIEKKFKDYLSADFQKIVENVIKRIKTEEFLIRIPQNIDLKVERGKVVKDKDLADGFIIEGKKWDIKFNWEGIKLNFEKELISEISKSILNEV